MQSPARPHVRLRELIAALAVLAITTGWTTPAQVSDPGTTAASISAAGARAASPTSLRAAKPAALEEAVPTTTWSLQPTGAAAFNAEARRHPGAFHAPAQAPVAKERVKVSPKPTVSKAAVTKTAKPKATPTAHKRVFEGTNHFWIPSLGMSYGVRSYACGRTSTPLNYIYRWGCAGTNNVYLLGHAWGVMKPLHDLYVSGGLHVGMVAVYADGNGRVRKYRVTEWRVVRPTQVAWQIASQPVPSMTLQTCIGANSQYRLNVRLVAFD